MPSWLCFPGFLYCFVEFNNVDEAQYWMDLKQVLGTLGQIAFLHTACMHVSDTHGPRMVEFMKMSTPKQKYFWGPSEEGLETNLIHILLYIYESTYCDL